VVVSVLDAGEPSRVGNESSSISFGSLIVYLVTVIVLMDLWSLGGRKIGALSRTKSSSDNGEDRRSMNVDSVTFQTISSSSEDKSSDIRLHDESDEGGEIISKESEDSVEGRRCAIFK